MKKIVSQKYAENKSWRQKFVGCKVYIISVDKSSLHGIVEGFEGIRAFTEEEVEDDPSEERIEVAFKHTPANKHNKRDQWWMFFGGDRVSLSDEARHVMYAGLDLDFPAWEVRQTRRIQKTNLPLFTDRTRAQAWLENNKELVEPTTGHRRQYGSL